MKSKFMTSVLLLISSSLAYSYEVETHVEISDHAARASILSTRLPDLGFVGLNSMLPSNTTQYGGAVWCFEGSGSGQRTIINLIRLGAFCEDATAGSGTQPLMRYFNHFYDPAHGGAGFAIWPLNWPSSLEWGLETTNVGAQDYSYKDARNYFYKALTLPAKTGRDTNWALTFRTLGNVMHLIQDLGQPQHTRNVSDNPTAFFPSSAR